MCSRCRDTIGSPNRVGRRRVDNGSQSIVHTVRCRPWPRSSRRAPSFDDAVRPAPAVCQMRRTSSWSRAMSPSPAKDRRVQTFGWQSPRPRSGDATRAGWRRLEVVAEREVPSISKKVWCRRDGPTFSRSLCLPLTRMHFCRRRGAPVVAPLGAEEGALELVHPGVGEEQRGVVLGDQRRAGHDAVAVTLEIVEKALANLSGRHRVHSSTRSGDRARRRRAAPAIAPSKPWRSRY